jgi:hypothetical protein
MLLFALTIGCVNGQVGIVQRVMASEKAALQKKPIHPFWDFSALNLTQVSGGRFWTASSQFAFERPSHLFVLFVPVILAISTDQRIALLDHTKAVNEAQQYVDWALLKDRYLIASFDRERRLGKRSARTRKRRRKNDWNVAEEARVDSNTSDKDALELKKAETLSSLTSLIADAAKNAGFDNIQEQIQEAQNRVQPRQDTTAPVGTTAPVVTDDILGTQSPVATPIPGATEAPVGGTQAPVGTDDATTTEAPVGTEAPAQAPAGTEAPVATDDATSTQPPQGGNDNGSPDEDSVIIPNYKYDEGNCPDAGDSAAAVPCAADLNLDVICDKYQEGSSFTACWEACIPSFCCIHGTFVSLLCRTLTANSVSLSLSLQMHLQPPT